MKNIWRGQSARTYTPLEDVSSVALKMERGGSGRLTPERSTSSSENGGKCLLIKRAGLLLGYKYRGLADFYLMNATRDVTYKYICLGQATDIKADVTAVLWIHCCRTSASTWPPRALAIVLKKSSGEGKISTVNFNDPPALIRSDEIIRRQDVRSISRAPMLRKTSRRRVSA